jgi:hypothetical protein
VCPAICPLAALPDDFLLNIDVHLDLQEILH